MGPRQRRNALAQCLLQLLHRVCGPRAERYQAAGQREEILDPMIHLAHQQGLAFLRFDAFTDVARDLGRADDLSLLIANRRDRQRHTDQRPILAPAERLAMLRTTYFADPADDTAFFMQPVFSDEERNLLFDLSSRT